MSASLITQLERVIRHDPANRGLLSSDDDFGPLCIGHLHQAAADLADASHVIIVTGFYVPRADPPAAETDGPPGAVLLAQTLANLGSQVTLVTDRFCETAVAAAIKACGTEGLDLKIAPDVVTDDWCKTMLGANWTDISHLVSVERVGPSHTTASIQGASTSEQKIFGDIVPGSDRDHCHNMRGDNIDEFTPQLHRLFEYAADHFPTLRSIGIGDGGNEIGMGCIEWHELFQRLPGDSAARVPCRIATDWNIVAGTSNWGAYALAAATALEKGNTEVLRLWNADHQRHVIQSMVENGPAVDGVTALPQATVDGLSFQDYIAPWIAIRKLLELE